MLLIDPTVALRLGTFAPSFSSTESLSEINFDPFGRDGVVKICVELALGDDLVWKDFARTNAGR